jgi:DNA-binding response OmpR family regulator
MIVDDDQTMISLLKILLEMDGFEVVNVNEVAHLAELIRKEDPDLVLMDVFLSGVDGKEVLVDLRKKEDLTDIKIVMTSGMDLADQCMDAGADAFLLKPYTPEQLMNIIQNNIREGGSSNRQPASLGE